MTTGYYTEYSGLQQDLDFHFEAGDSGPSALTGFLTSFRSSTPDLARIFAPAEDGDILTHNTGYVATDGRDLRLWFCKKGTQVPEWPLNGGFMLYQNGQVMQATGAVQIWCGRQSWSISGATPTDTALSNPVADFNFVCPGAARANAGSWIDQGAFSRTAMRRLPRNAVLRFLIYTSGLGGFGQSDITCTVGTHSPGWTSVNNGGVGLCSSASPYYTDTPNVLAFTPAVNTYYGMMAPQLIYNGVRDWTINVSSVFATNIANGGLNEQRLTITRIA